MTVTGEHPLDTAEGEEALLGLPPQSAWSRVREMLRNANQVLDQTPDPRSIPAADGGAHDLRAFGPLLVVVLSAVFGLWTLRTESTAVPYPNDSSVHLQTVQFALERIKEGHLPFSSWFPDLSLGSPFLMHYQSAPAVLASLLGLAIGAPRALSFSLYYLLALWPISIYFATRLLGWDRWPAAASAAVAPLLVSTVGYGYENGSYVWFGSGLWPQLWAMWVLPLAIGFGWQAISQRRHYFAAMLTMGLTIAFHFLTAYFLGLAFVVLVLLRPSQIFRRVARGAVVGTGALLATLWVTVPLVKFGKWSAENEFIKHTFWEDSYGARKILHWLITGALYDSGRVPVVTVLVAIGLLVCLFRSRRDERSRALVALWLMSLLLYFGRTTWGSLIDVLPGNKDLLLHRYIAAVQLCGIFLAGVGAVWLGAAATQIGISIYRALCKLRLPSREWFARFIRPGAAVLRVLSRAMQRTAPGLASFFARHRKELIGGLLGATALVIALEPAWSSVAAYDYLSASSGIRAQQVVDVTQQTDLNRLLSIVTSSGNGRVYAGEPSNWGRQFLIGQIPVYIYLADEDIDAVGFTLRTYSLMNGPEAYFDESNLADYELFGVRFLLLPVDHPPPVPATFVEQAGQYLLYSLATTGYLAVVDSTGTIAANASDLGQQTASLLATAVANHLVLPTIAYAGETAAPATLPIGSSPAGPAGVVNSQLVQLDQGVVDATVTLNRTAVVLLTSSFDPGWSVTIDGVPTTTEMLAPALVGVAVAPGTHTIVFRYQGYSGYLLLFGLSALAVLVFGLGPIFWRRHRRQQARVD